MEYETSIERVCQFFIELSENVRKLSLVSEIIDFYKGKKSNTLETLIRMLDQMTPVIEKQMDTFLEEKLEYTPNLASILVNTKKAEVEVKNLQPILKIEQIEHNKSANVHIKKQSDEEEILLETIETIQEQETKQKSKSPVENIIKCILDAERKIEVELDLIEAQYKVLREINKAREKDLFTAKKRSEREYLGMLEKYDEDVGSFYRTMKSLSQESTLLDAKLKNLEDKMTVQEIIYEELRTERETELIKAFTRDLDNFKRNRAARIIQNSWRKYLEKLALRKKKKSKKKR
ncbi:dynein regulatory complex protein 10-like isoform X2 [Chelonus insularis]|nr:dynein regulatory complex protein 10-like isoform X2 [Chelonus insularis]